VAEFIALIQPVKTSSFAKESRYRDAAAIFHTDVATAKPLYSMGLCD
jgi:hypothetical protein